MLQLQPDLVGDCLNLALVGARGNHKAVGKGRDAAQIEHQDFGSFLGLCGADGNQPGWRNGSGGGGSLQICLGQNTLLNVSYYIARHPRIKRLANARGSDASRYREGAVFAEYERVLMKRCT